MPRLPRGARQLFSPPIRHVPSDLAALRTHTQLGRAQLSTTGAASQGTEVACGLTRQSSAALHPRPARPRAREARARARAARAIANAPGAGLSSPRSLERLRLRLRPLSALVWPSRSRLRDRLTPRAPSPERAGERVMVCAREGRTRRRARGGTACDTLALQIVRMLREYGSPGGDWPRRRAEAAEARGWERLRAARTMPRSDAQQPCSPPVR